jgi:hypothetical protein
MKQAEKKVTRKAAARQSAPKKVLVDRPRIAIQVGRQFRRSQMPPSGRCDLLSFEEIKV